MMKTLKITLGGEGACTLDTGVPALNRPASEIFLPEGGLRQKYGAVTTFETSDWLVGGGTIATVAGHEEAGNLIYTDLLNSTREWHLARIWNYAPAINQLGSSGLENYRAFSRGRSLAFEERFGTEFAHNVPAASAVGTSSSNLTVVFAASRAPVEFLENPLQVPAYHYPREYGPRAPSFARAAVVKKEEESTVFISGTAAVRGHETVAPLDTVAQLECTLENLREISLAAGLGPDLAASRQKKNGARIFKVYVRDEKEFETIARVLEKRLLVSDDVVSYVRSDICRKNLTVEIEATVNGGDVQSAG